MRTTTASSSRHSVTTSFGKLGLSGSVGGNLMERKHNGPFVPASASLIVPNLFSLTNGTDKPDNSESYSHNEDQLTLRYGTAELGRVLLPRRYAA